MARSRVAGLPGPLAVTNAAETFELLVWSLPMWRYAVGIAIAGCEFHPSPVAGGGVGTDAPIGIDAPVGGDAPSVTADAPDPMCPAGWFTILGTSSRYLVVNSDATWHAAEAACEAAKLPGGLATHLLVLDTAAEATALTGSPGLGDFDYWIGMVQPLDQLFKIGGWREITGGDGIVTRWRLGEPNDGSLGLTDGNAEQFATANGDLYLDDRPGTQSLRRICECDGVPVDSTIAVPP